MNQSSFRDKQALDSTNVANTTGSTVLRFLRHGYEMAEQKVIVRRPQIEDLDDIFKMGFDVWADGLSLENYLEVCRTSPKYSQGEWFVLEKTGHLLSSLLVHSFADNIYGIGSIATNASYRKNGFASFLIENVLNELQTIRSSQITYLYSDINPRFYEKFWFKFLPQEFQKYKTTTCMVRYVDPETDFGKLKPPDYF